MFKSGWDGLEKAEIVGENGETILERCCKNW